METTGGFRARKGLLEMLLGNMRRKRQQRRAEKEAQQAIIKRRLDIGKECDEMLAAWAASPDRVTAWEEYNELVSAKMWIWEGEGRAPPTEPLDVAKSHPVLHSLYQAFVQGRAMPPDAECEQEADKDPRELYVLIRFLQTFKLADVDKPIRPYSYRIVGTGQANPFMEYVREHSQEHFARYEAEQAARRQLSTGPPTMEEPHPPEAAPPPSLPRGRYVPAVRRAETVTATAVPVTASAAPPTETVVEERLSTDRSLYWRRSLIASSASTVPSRGKELADE